MKIMNLTAHDVCVKNRQGDIVTYPQSGYVARAVSRYEEYSELDDNVVIEKEIEPELKFGIENIDPFTIYIVSYQFAMKLKFMDFKYKHQFVYPCACKAEREDKTNKVLFVPSLISIGY